MRERTNFVDQRTGTITLKGMCHVLGEEKTRGQASLPYQHYFFKTLNFVSYRIMMY